MIQAGTIRIGSGLHLLSRRLVLDQLDKPVAVDHLAGRDGDVTADLECFRAGRRPCADDPLPVLQEVPEALHEVLAAGLQDAPLHCRVRRQEIRGRAHVEDLARQELDHGLVLLRDAVDPGRGVVPPLLLQQESPGK